MSAAQPTPQLIIFDCDGVLVDSERLSHEVLQGLLAEWGVRMSRAFEAGLQPVAGVHAVLPGLKVPYCVTSNVNHAKVNFTLAPTMAELAQHLRATGAHA